MKKTNKTLVILFMMIIMFGCTAKKVDAETLMSNLKQVCSNASSSEEVISPLPGKLSKQIADNFTGYSQSKIDRIIALGCAFGVDSKPSPNYFLFDKEGLIIVNVSDYVKKGVLTQEEVKELNQNFKEYEKGYGH